MMFRHKSLLVVLLFAASLAAQVQSGKPVTFMVTVTDGRSRVVSGLRQQDFELHEDGTSQAIARFETFRNVPSSVGVLIDVSGSMKPRLAKASNAIEDFVDGLYKDDELFLMPFSDESRVAADYTDSRPDFTKALRQLTTGGNTALYDAMNEGIRKLRQGHYDRKILLLVGDGTDSGSGITYQQVIRAIRESDVLVYALGIPATLGSIFYTPSNNFAGQIVIGGPSRPQPIPIPLPGGRTIPIPVPGQPVPLPTPPEQEPPPGETVNMSVLTAFADASAGRAWRVDGQQGRGETIERILPQLLSELRGQYAIGFVPQHPLKDNQWHDVRIRTKETGYNVRARTEYLGK